jgi:hypothetical protein
MASIDELIKTDETLAAKQAAAMPHLSLRFTKIVSPGAG